MYIDLLYFIPKLVGHEGDLFSNLNSQEKGLIPTKLTTKLHPEEIDDWNITIPLDTTSF